MIGNPNQERVLATQFTKAWRAVWIVIAVKFCNSLVAILLFDPNRHCVLPTRVRHRSKRVRVRRCGGESGQSDEQPLDVVRSG